ncbi:unnamed protein product [Adineta ricciae]|uniref:Uncharacterized protein n=1 Tax=Adineta ricciae TaxID=249248 RepID=A0A816HMK9_ADIRI|nr:unnamed protein product [Adineta ricciae]CAF1689336.1 unnamed protein product [Adineta ricciae]
MFSTSVVINNHLHYDTSSSPLSSSSYSSLDISEDDDFLSFNNRSSQQLAELVPSDQNDFIDCSTRSRSYKHMNGQILESKLTQLINENEILRAKIDMLTRKYGHLNSPQDELKSVEQPTVSSILDQSSRQIHQSDNNSTVMLTEHLASMPVKLRFKVSNITGES